jgi:hypothetical protein
MNIGNGMIASMPFSSTLKAEPKKHLKLKHEIAADQCKKGNSSSKALSFR